MKKIIILLLSLVFALQTNAQTLQGHRYRGSVEASFLVGNDGVYKDFNATGGGISTSHGYQLNPNIFLGGGIAYHYYSLDYFDGHNAVPVFANFRVNMNSNKVSPFFDAKIGYSAGDFEGLYASPSFGVRVGIKDNLGVNFSIGYTAQGFKYEDYDLVGHLHLPKTEKSYIHSITISVGLDF